MLTVGTYLADRYEILGKIGTGGMSDVYKAKDHSLGRFVAVKVLKSEFSEDVNFVAKFRSEAQSAAGLEHPNIVNIYDVGSENGFHYIVMEYVEGITLKTYIEKKERLTYKEAVSIAIQVARGIEAAHNKNIIHRDIKPQNIIISTEGKVKVTDFGIARAATSNTINSDVMGSVHYSSPEQARNGFVDGKSDIYSLGIVMYEMVTGRVPFDGESTVAIAIQHLQEDMISPAAYASDLPVSIEKVILKCTQKSADRRYQSMEDLLVDLKKVLISPDEDFVTIAPVSSDKTRIITDDELQQIRAETDDVNLSSEDDNIEEEDEDDEAELNPKMDKAVTILGIVAAIIIVAVLVLILGNVFGVFNFGSSSKGNDTVAEESEENMVTMIDVTGESYAQAKADLEEIGLEIANGGTVSSETVEEGDVVSQSIDEGEEVEEGTTVTVMISSGPGKVDVPDVEGLEADTAQSMIEDEGLICSKEYEYSSIVASGRVISQTPEAGEDVNEGDTVTIVISQGVESVQVPDIEGKSKSAAKSALESVGLKLGTVTKEYSDTVSKGKVISQGIASGKYVDSGTKVSVVISLGPETKSYSFATTITAPKTDDDVDVESADITLYDSSGNVIDTWSNVGISEFGTSGYKISISGITASSKGKLIIIWYLSDGSTSKQTSSVSFTEE